MHVEYDDSGEICAGGNFQLRFDQEVAEADPLEVCAFDTFVRNLPGGPPDDWPGRPIKSEPPDYLIDQTDGTFPSTIFHREGATPATLRDRSETEDRPE